MIDLDNIDTIDFTKTEPIRKEQYLNFIQSVKNAIKSFKSIPKNETIRLISHLDADGITSAALILNAVKNENRKYKLTIYSQLTDEVCQELSKENYKYYIITDLGSSQLKSINKHLSNKKIIILDHHEIQDKANEDICHVNAHQHKIDASGLISGAGTVFFFSCLLNKANYNMAHLALIGAIGDVQEKEGFKGLNTIILDIAVEHKKIFLKKELNLFGKQTRPLVKLLEYSSDLNIPRVTGNEKQSLFFLRELGINPSREDDTAKTFVDLTDEEKRILTEHIIIRRINAGLDDQSKVLTNTYELVDEENGIFKDAREFSTILNACGRMDQAKIGVYACLNEAGFKDEAKDVHKDYKREIVNGMNWFNKNKKNPIKIIKNEKYMIINAQSNVLHTIIGTIASILSMGNKYKKDYYILSLAHNKLEETIKISMRVVGNNKDIDLQKIVTEIIKKLGCGEAGGHQHAAGAIIPISKEDEFLNIAQDVLDAL